ncbi:uncharacterized protein LY79DRAFT_358285 [Colletotrichum navitas]|uniref:Secreted protein n=1 Tax=Colletotrichum navitas TaxID=681940 RepID=A0AAD8V0Z9_9PEZI|nr:uncharacterized protein LY79DRAFT_358285 [Colletotrichum navitas]KAK1579187.1 hypothetical protein LY79DRAFT_358285 [Colletotrichum navitas]
MRRAARSLLSLWYWLVPLHLGGRRPRILLFSARFAPPCGPSRSSVCQQPIYSTARTWLMTRSRTFPGSFKSWEVSGRRMRGMPLEPVSGASVIQRI